jgi:integrase
MQGHILPAIGKLQLREIQRSHLQTLINSLVDDRKLSSQTITHVRAYISGVLHHAHQEHILSGDLPTVHLTMPRRKKRNPIPPLSFEQAQFVLGQLQQPYLTMAALSCCTSVGVAEMTGLKRCRLNLSGEIIMVGDKLLPPLSAWIAEDWSQKEFRETKTEYRDRIIPIPVVLVPLLGEVLQSNPFKHPDDPVFASRTGKPVNDNNANKRVFKPLGAAIGVDFSWNSFRHTFASRAEDVGIRQFDKKALMGHSLTADITDGYTQEGWQRMQAVVNALADKFGIESLVNQRKEKVACRKVVSIRQKRVSATSSLPAAAAGLA